MTEAEQIRDISTVRGSVFDLPHAMSLSPSDCNVLLVSSRTLFFIQLFGTGEMDFLSRYASSFLSGNRYFLANSDTEKDDINDLVNNYELEVQAVTCDLTEALNALSASISSIAQVSCGGCGSEIDPDGLPTPPIGPGEPWETQPEYDTYKCRGANWLLDGLIDLFTKLQLYDVDFWTSTTVAAGAALVTAVMFTTLIGGWVVIVAGVIIGLVVKLILGTAIDLSDIITELEAFREELICALYAGTTAEVSKADFATVLDSTALNSAEKALLNAILVNSLVNQIYEWNDVINSHPETTSCVTCVCVPEFVFTRGSVVSGVANVEGTPFTVRSIFQGPNYRTTFSIQAPGGCPCVDYNIEVVSSVPPFVQVGLGEISDCALVDVWRYNNQGYAAIIDTWPARAVDIGHTAQNDVVFIITSL